jgi:hypothetical protein
MTRCRSQQPDDGRNANDQKKNRPQDEASLDVVVERLERGRGALLPRAQGLLRRLPGLDVGVVVLLHAFPVLQFSLLSLLARVAVAVAVAVGRRRRRAAFSAFHRPPLGFVYCERLGRGRPLRARAPLRARLSPLSLSVGFHVEAGAIIIVLSLALFSDGFVRVLG